MFRDRDPARSTRRAIAVNLLNEYAERTDELIELLLNADSNEYAGYLRRLERDKAGAIERLGREIRTTPGGSGRGDARRPPGRPASDDGSSPRAARPWPSGRAGRGWPW